MDRVLKFFVMSAVMTVTEFVAMAFDLSLTGFFHPASQVRETALVEVFQRGM